MIYYAIQSIDRDGQWHTLSMRYPTADKRDKALRLISTADRKWAMRYANKFEPRYRPITMNNVKAKA